MTSTADDPVLGRIRKLLALAEGRGSEAESLRAMEQVHKMLAQHNLSLDWVGAHQRAAPARSRTIDETQFDLAVDRWATSIWHATGDLFFCTYFYREEGAHDRRGQWRCLRLRHCLVGSEANKVTAKVMADHFCRVIRKLARQHVEQFGGGLAARRSFEQGCAGRLVERIGSHKASSSQRPTLGTTLPALIGLYDAERMANDAALHAQGIMLQPGRKRAPRKAGDVLAEHYGRTAAENISLALQIGAAPQRKGVSEPVAVAASQIDFAF